MNDKWEARSDRLHMCEYSSGLRNRRPLLEVAGTTPCLEETPWRYNALGPCPPLLSPTAALTVPRMVPLLSCGFRGVRQH